MICKVRCFFVSTTNIMTFCNLDTLNQLKMYKTSFRSRADTLLDAKLTTQKFACILKLKYLI